MRKSNSIFKTNYISESGTQLENKDYFGFVELDKFACYVLADSLDEDNKKCSSKIVVENIIQSFMEHPSISKSNFRRYINAAHNALLKEKGGMRLKSSVTIIITDYVKVRYCTIGNSRFHLLRGNRFIATSHDQSLTDNLVEKELIPADKAALHEERNNLYSYLGQDGGISLEISKKIKLEDGDAFLALSRGIWEYCNEGEVLDACEEAEEPQEVINAVEDLILSKQPEEIANYTLAVTFIEKTYVKPKKKNLKKILLIAIPIAIVILTMCITFFVLHRIKVKDQNSMEEYTASGEHYIEFDNHKKAIEAYEEALKLAKKLGQKKEKQELEDQLMLLNQIISGDEQFLAGEYQKAMDTYLSALELSYTTGNVGRNYIEKQLDRNNQYIEVFDLLEEGEFKEGYEDYTGAKEAYVKARQLSAALYYNDGKKEAREKISTVNEEIAAQEKAAKDELQEEIDEAIKEKAVQQELDNQARTNEQTSATELENKGNELLAAKDPQGAISYFETASAVFASLEMDDKVELLDEKIKAAKNIMANMQTAQE